MDFRALARDPCHRRQFEILLLLAAQQGEAHILTERLGWGVDPNCTTRRGRTALILNARHCNPNAAVVRVLLGAGIVAGATDDRGLSALDYARRNMIKMSQRTRRRRRSRSLDENGQLQLADFEQADLNAARRKLEPELGSQFARAYWKERRRTATRVFNDPREIDAIISLLEEQE